MVNGGYECIAGLLVISCGGKEAVGKLLEQFRKCLISHSKYFPIALATCLQQRINLCGQFDQRQFGGQSPPADGISVVYSCQGATSPTPT